MKRVLAALLLFFLLAFPARLFAKGQTVKITITGFDLKKPIQITAPQVLTKFNIWTGPGTGSSEPGFNPNVPGFIVDWSYGAVSGIPDGLTSYEVEFYSKLPNERLTYVVYYVYDPSARKGYVYLPGKDDVYYLLNISTIYRRVEGHWFRSWSAWDNVVIPLIRASLLRYDPGETGMITGTVVDSAGRPIHNASVYLAKHVEGRFLMVSPRVLTDHKWALSDTYLTAGDYDVFAAPTDWPTGFSRWKQRVHLPQYKPKTKVTFRIRSSDEAS